MINKFNRKKTKNIKRIDKFLSFFYKKPVVKVVPLNEINHIVIIDFSLIGDMVMNIPFLKTIKHNCPLAKISMICEPWAQAVLGNQGLVDEFIVFDGKNKLSSPFQIIKSFKEIKKVIKRINIIDYELAIEPKGDLRHIWFMHHINCLRSITYNYTGGDYFVTDCFLPKEGTVHLIDEKLNLLDFVGFNICECDRIPKLSIDNKTREYLNEYKQKNDLCGKRVIGIHPGASTVSKQFKYFPELFVRLKPLMSQCDIVCVFEGPSDKDIVDLICCTLENMPLRYLRIKENLQDYIRLVAICDYMICNDSAAGHIATAYGIDTSVVFCSTIPSMGVPRGYCTVKCISYNVECKPCTLPECTRKYECMKEAMVDDIVSSMYAFLISPVK